MSPEWTLVALLAVVACVLVSELRDHRHDLATERAARRRLETRFRDRLRAQRQIAAPWQAKGALPAAPVPEPASEPLALEVAGLAFADPPPIIDLPHNAAHTEERPLPTLPPPKAGQRFPKPDPKKNQVNPMRPDHELFRLRWPGQTKENARVN